MNKKMLNIVVNAIATIKKINDVITTNDLYIEW